MQYINFTKMHGLGNDFVIIDESKLPLTADYQNLITRISHRRKGVGCDQFILYNYHDKDNVTMKIYNQDGSVAAACGNASRCLGRLIFDKMGEKNIKLNVDNRIVSVEYEDPKHIQVNMGVASFDKAWMPELEQLWQLAEKYNINQKEILCVDVGNDHLIIFTPITKPDQKILVADFQQSQYFANGVNIHFAKIEGDIINLTSWERGVGLTEACGSGAVATFAAARKLGFINDNQDKIEIKFASGSLFMSAYSDSIIMSGPAEYVFEGQFYL